MPQHSLLQACDFIENNVNLSLTDFVSPTIHVGADAKGLVHFNGSADNIVTPLLDVGDRGIRAHTLYVGNILVKPELEKMKGFKLLPDSLTVTLPPDATGRQRMLQLQESPGLASFTPVVKSVTLSKTAPTNEANATKIDDKGLHIGETSYGVNMTSTNGSISADNVTISSSALTVGNYDILGAVRHMTDPALGVNKLAPLVNSILPYAYNGLDNSWGLKLDKSSNYPQGLVGSTNGVSVFVDDKQYYIGSANGTSTGASINLDQSEQIDIMQRQLEETIHAVDAVSDVNKYYIKGEDIYYGTIPNILNLASSVVTQDIIDTIAPIDFNKEQRTLPCKYGPFKDGNPTKDIGYIRSIPIDEIIKSSVHHAHAIDKSIIDAIHIDASYTTLQQAIDGIKETEYFYEYPDAVAIRVTHDILTPVVINKPGYTVVIECNGHNFDNTTLTCNTPVKILNGDFNNCTVVTNANVSMHGCRFFYTRIESHDSLDITSSFFINSDGVIQFDKTAEIDHCSYINTNDQGTVHYKNCLYCNSNNVRGIEVGEEQFVDPESNLTLKYAINPLQLNQTSLLDINGKPFQPYDVGAVTQLPYIPTVEDVNVNATSTDNDPTRCLFAVLDRHVKLTGQWDQPIPKGSGLISGGVITCSSHLDIFDSKLEGVTVGTFSKVSKSTLTGFESVQGTFTDCDIKSPANNSSSLTCNVYSMGTDSVYTRCHIYASVVSGTKNTFNKCVFYDNAMDDTSHFTRCTFLRVGSSINMVDCATVVDPPYNVKDEMPPPQLDIRGNLLNNPTGAYGHYNVDPSLLEIIYNNGGEYTISHKQITLTLNDDVRPITLLGDGTVFTNCKLSKSVTIMRSTCVNISRCTVKNSLLTGKIKDVVLYNSTIDNASLNGVTAYNCTFTNCTNVNYLKGTGNNYSGSSTGIIEGCNITLGPLSGFIDRCTIDIEGVIKDTTINNSLISGQLVLTNCKLGYCTFNDGVTVGDECEQLRCDYESQRMKFNGRTYRIPLIPPLVPRGDFVRDIDGTLRGDYDTGYKHLYYEKGVTDIYVLGDGSVKLNSYSVLHGNNYTVKISDIGSGVIVSRSNIVDTTLNKGTYVNSSFKNCNLSSLEVRTSSVVDSKVKDVIASNSIFSNCKGVMPMGNSLCGNDLLTSRLLPTNELYTINTGNQNLGMDISLNERHDGNIGAKAYAKLPDEVWLSPRKKGEPIVTDGDKTNDYNSAFMCKIVHLSGEYDFTKYTIPNTVKLYGPAKATFSVCDADMFKIDCVNGRFVGTMTQCVIRDGSTFGQLYHCTINSITVSYGGNPVNCLIVGNRYEETGCNLSVTFDYVDSNYVPIKSMVNNLIYERVQLPCTVDGTYNSFDVGAYHYDYKLKFASLLSSSGDGSSRYSPLNKLDDVTGDVIMIDPYIRNVDLKLKCNLISLDECMIFMSTITGGKLTNMNVTESTIQSTCLTSKFTNCKLSGEYTNCRILNPNYISAIPTIVNDFKWCSFTANSLNNGACGMSDVLCTGCFIECGAAAKPYPSVYENCLYVSEVPNTTKGLTIVKQTDVYSVTDLRPRAAFGDGHRAATDIYDEVYNKGDVGAYVYVPTIYVSEGYVADAIKDINVRTNVVLGTARIQKAIDLKGKISLYGEKTYWCPYVTNGKVTNIIMNEAVNVHAKYSYILIENDNTRISGQFNDCVFTNVNATSTKSTGLILAYNCCFNMSIPVNTFMYSCKISSTDFNGTGIMSTHGQLACNDQTPCCVSATTAYDYLGTRRPLLNNAGDSYSNTSVYSAVTNVLTSTECRMRESINITGVNVAIIHGSCSNAFPYAQVNGYSNFDPLSNLLSKPITIKGGSVMSNYKLGLGSGITITLDNVSTVITSYANLVTSNNCTLINGLGVISIGDCTVLYGTISPTAGTAINNCRMYGNTLYSANDAPLIMNRCTFEGVNIQYLDVTVRKCTFTDMVGSFNNVTLYDTYMLGSSSITQLTAFNSVIDNMTIPNITATYCTIMNMSNFTLNGERNLLYKCKQVTDDGDDMVCTVMNGYRPIRAIYKSLTSKIVDNYSTTLDGRARLPYTYGAMSIITVLYVSKEGNDSNSGTIESPLLTLGHATTIMPAGHINISTGVYVSPNISNSTLEANGEVTLTGGQYTNCSLENIMFTDSNVLFTSCTVNNCQITNCRQVGENSFFTACTIDKCGLFGDGNSISYTYLKTGREELNIVSVYSSFVISNGALTSAEIVNSGISAKVYPNKYILAHDGSTVCTPAILATYRRLSPSLALTTPDEIKLFVEGTEVYAYGYNIAFSIITQLSTNGLMIDHFIPGVIYSLLNSLSPLEFVNTLFNSYGDVDLVSTLFHGDTHIGSCGVETYKLTVGELTVANDQLTLGNTILTTEGITSNLLTTNNIISKQVNCNLLSTIERYLPLVNIKPSLVEDGMGIDINGITRVEMVYGPFSTIGVRTKQLGSV